MKKYFIVPLLLFSSTLLAQSKKLTLAECVGSALANKANVQSVRTDALVAQLQELEAKNKYTPQLSLAYEYKGYPIIPSQVLPIGQFNAIPTNEVRAIKFGTKFQQNANVNLTQPVIDFSIRAKIAESRINEKVKQADVKAAEEDLTYEVVKSFGKLLSNTQKIQSAVTDSARTYRSYQLIQDKFAQKQVLKSDVNKAVINHNNAVASYKAAVADLTKEKIYLSFLTAIPVDVFMDRTPDLAPLVDLGSAALSDSLRTDSLASIKQLNAQQELYLAQAKTERSKIRPTFNIIGSIGANQFTNELNPVRQDTWFGDSYVGISVKMPLTGENVRNRSKQYETQAKRIDLDRSETQNKLIKDYLQAKEDVKKYQEQVRLNESNVALYTENVALFQSRFNAGQYSAGDLNLQGLDLLKERNNLLQAKSDQISSQIDALKASGNLTNFVNHSKRN